MNLGVRMKNYESVSKNFLIRKMPVIIRIDGKSFHSWTKKDGNLNWDDSLLEGPFSHAMNTAMSETCAMLLENIQNAVLVYTQSDEISILLRDWDNHETQQWFNANLQKMVSISSSLTTGVFNKIIQSVKSYKFGAPSSTSLAFFDSRIFNLPKEEVTNYFIWRQQDASRNSIQMLGRFYFSHKEMYGKNNSDIQDMLVRQHNVNWNDLQTWKKRGTCVYKPQDGGSIKIDKEPPIFTQDRNFIDRFLNCVDK